MKKYRVTFHPLAECLLSTLHYRKLLIQRLKIVLMQTRSLALVMKAFRNYLKSFYIQFQQTISRYSITNTHICCKSQEISMRCSSWERALSDQFTKDSFQVRSQHTKA